MNKLNILLINNKSKSVEKLHALLSSFGSVIQIEYNQLSKMPLDNIDLIVLSGSSELNVNHNRSKLNSEIELINASNIPIIGICFGFELICTTFGGVTTEGLEKLDDFRIIRFKNNFFKLDNKTIAVKESHKWNVEQVGEDLEVLATSDSGIEIVKHKNKPIFGFQFHPELYTELTQGDDLFKSVLEYIFD